MKFEEALIELKNGKAIKRKGSKYGVKTTKTRWGGTIIGLEDFKYPYYFSASEVLADDWEIVECE